MSLTLFPPDDNVTIPVAVADGGTGADNASDALTNLGGISIEGNPAAPVINTDDELYLLQNNVLVAGAGTEVVDGEYTYRGVANGKPYYNLVGQPDSDGEYCVAWDSGNGYWRIIASTGMGLLYLSIDDTAFPWQAVFTTGGDASGDSPAPTVTADPAVKTITVEQLDLTISPLQRVSAVVETNVGTKQDLLPAVPTGYIRIVTQSVIRNASTTLVAMSDSMAQGFRHTADDGGISFSASRLSLLGGFTVAIAQALDVNDTTQKIGSAGESWGCKFNDTSITATLTIDTFYYDIAI